MVVECRFCKKTFQYKYLLNRHNKRKTKCQSNQVQAVEEKVEVLNNKLDETILRLDEIYHKENTEDEVVKENTEDKVVQSENDKYKCKYCYKTFAFQSGLCRHLKNGLCKMKNDNIAIYEKELGISNNKETCKLVCKYCNYTFATKSAFSRHKNGRCGKRDEYEHELENRVLENRKNLAASISINGNNNNNTTTNNTVNNNNNIFLPPMNAFGNENLDYITTKMLLKQIELCKDFTDITQTVKTFTQLIHAHPAHPENHNVLLKGNNSPFAEVFNGKQFEQSNALVVEDQILQKVGRLLLEKKNEYCEEQEKKEKKIPRKIESNLMKLEESIDDNINSELFRETVADTSRNLTTYRNAVKGALISKKDEIQDTQNLIKGD